MMNRQNLQLGLAIAFSCAACVDTDSTLGDPDVEQTADDSAGNPDVHHGTILMNGVEQDIDYEIVDGRAVLDGDIIVPWSDFVRGGLRSAHVKRDASWPQGVVPFEIDSALPNQQRVTDAIAHWNTRTGVRLVPRNGEADFVRFTTGSGCSATIGHAGGAQTVMLDSTCSTGNAIHETGHAIGLYHEQARADRDSYVTINWSNIESDKSFNFNKYSSGVDAGPYDYDSIMHYGSLAFSSNGQPTITKKDGSTIAGQRNGLSPGDLLGVETLYGPSYQIGRSAAIGKDGKIDVFVKGTDNAIWHVKQTAPSGGWGGWQSLGGNVRSTPTVARNLDGRLEMLAVGWDNQVYHQWQDANGNWSGWANRGGSIKGLPIVGRNLDGRLEVFALGTDNTIQHMWQVAPNSGWSGWATFGGSFAGNPAVALNLDGRLSVFGIGTDGQLWQVTQVAPSSTWGGLSSLGGSLKGTPAVGRNLDGRLEVVATGTDNLLTHKWQNGSGSWIGWTTFGVSVLGSPTIGRNADGRLEVIATGADQSLGHLWQVAPNTGWSGWASYGGTTSTRLPDVVVNQDGRMEVFTVGINDRALYHVWQNAPSSGWSGWAPYNGLAVIAE